MSPSSFNSAGWAGVFTVGLSGYLSSINVQGTYVVRSVINLKADTQFTGSGTIDSPFEVVGA